MYLLLNNILIYSIWVQISECISYEEFTMLTPIESNKQTLKIKTWGAFWRGWLTLLDGNLAVNWNFGMVYWMLCSPVFMKITAHKFNERMISRTSFKTWSIHFVFKWSLSFYCYYNDMIVNFLFKTFVFVQIPWL